MNFNEKTEEAGHAGAWGSLERASFPNDDSGEKSLLRLIEERSAKESQKGASYDNDPLRIDALDDIDEECRPELDHLMIRLGGNGF
jgi:hypothetical protein